MSRNPVRGAARLAAILDALPDALLLVDSNGVVVNANAVALELFEGESAERLLRTPISALLPGYGKAVSTGGTEPAALSAGSAASPRAGNAGPVRSRPERLAALRTDGRPFPAEVSCAELPDEDENLTLLVVRDLTGVLDVEAELRRQQRQIELILRAASEGIVGVDHEGRIVLVNPAGARILRHRASDLGGQDAHELIAHSNVDGTPVPAEKCLLIDSLRTGTKHHSLDEVLWRSDGTSVTVDMTTAPVNEGDAIIGAVMTFADNSEARASVRRARELAEVLDGELRGPLASVLADLRDVAQFGIGELGPDVRRSLASATSDLTEVVGLVEDIVDYQHMVVGDVPIERETVPLSQIVDAAMASAEEAAAAMGVDLVAHAADVEVAVDPALFAKMVSHLLADMVTASPVGGKVVVTAARRGPVARIEIRGPHTGGGPLHLPIAQAIVGRHGGTVTTHRIAGKGNTHVVEVPIDPPARPAGSPAALARSGAAPKRAVPALMTARYRAPVAAAPVPSPALPEVEKSNGHHTSHLADSRRQAAPAAQEDPPARGHNGQGRIPTQSRSVRSRALGVDPLDLKPSKPLPTSDVWSRPRRAGGESDPGVPDVNQAADTVDGGRRESAAEEPPENRPLSRSYAAEDRRQPQPWKPQAPQEPAAQSAGVEPAAVKPETVEPEAVTPVAVEPATVEPAAIEPRAEEAAEPATAPQPADGDAAPPRGRRRAALPNAQGAPGVTPVPSPAAPSAAAAPPEPLPQPATVTPAARSADETQLIPPVVDDPPDAPEPEAPAQDGPHLLLWPDPDPGTLELLAERGYVPLSLGTHDALPAVLDGRPASAPRPSAVLVDPIAAPITRRGLRTLRGAAMAANLPILVTAGIGGTPSLDPQGPDPALLLQALTPGAVTLPRVLLVEARDDVAEAMTASLERRGMQVLHALTDGDSVARASDGVPDVVVMDLMQIRRRRVGIIEWLRDHERLITTPIVVYTALGTDAADFAEGLRSGRAALCLAERATGAEVGNRIIDLLSKVTGF